MWFKQAQIFQIDGKISNFEELLDNLNLLAFKPCLPSHHDSKGWFPPLEVDNVEEPELARRVDNFIMLCLQIEEKILPATVIRNELAKRIKEIELRDDRKVRGKEKLSLKDEVTFTLLPRAFSKFSKIYGYIDTKTSQLILSNTSETKAELFTSMLTKVLGEDIYPMTAEKLAPTITPWLKHGACPSGFSIEKSCVLQDPNQQTRMIRAQQQDLFAQGIQSLLQDGCEVKQLALSWQGQVQFHLAEGFLLQGIKFNDDIVAHTKDIEIESKAQQFDANFMIMAKTLSNLLQELSRYVKPLVKPEKITEEV